MSSSKKQQYSTKNAPSLWSKQFYLTAFATVGTVLLLSVFLSLSFTSRNKESTKAQISNLAAVVSSKTDVAIVTEEAGGISYYHCKGPSPSPGSKEIPLVLLHGARFSKEDWKKPSGILEDLCNRKTNQRRLSVFAVDLPVSATYEDLINFLEALKVQKKIHAPVALVSPSASGLTMATWAAAATLVKETLPKYIERWIPVAAVAFLTAPERDVQRLQGLLPILAIYGDKDRAGKQSSERLHAFAGATTLEIVGTHPCYLDSPKEFVDELIKFVD